MAKLSRGSRTIKMCTNQDTSCDFGDIKAVVHWCSGWRSDISKFWLVNDHEDQNNKPPECSEGSWQWNFWSYTIMMRKPSLGYVPTAYVESDHTVDNGSQSNDASMWPMSVVALQAKCMISFQVPNDDETWATLLSQKFTKPFAFVENSLYGLCLKSGNFTYFD